MKKLLITMAVASLTFSGAAQAALITGSMSVVVDPFVVPTSSFTASSLSLNQLNLVTAAETGTFLSVVPALSDITAYTGTITGLSTSPVAAPISNFFLISKPDGILLTSGTTPNDRLVFNLATITEQGSSVSGGWAVFTGTGTLVDTQSVYSDTPAQFTISFSGRSNYSFTLQAVAAPEPATWALMLGGLGLLVFCVRRKSALLK